MNKKIFILSVLFIFISASFAFACLESFDPPVISLDVPATAENGSQITVVAAASDDHGVNYISLFDGSDNWLGGYFCGNTTTCTVSFALTVPSEIGAEYSYKAYVYDIDGLSAEASGAGITTGQIIPPVPPTPPNNHETVPDDFKADLAVTSFVIENADFIKDGDTMRFYFRVENNGEKNLREVTFSASIPELGVKAPAIRTKELKSGQSISRLQYIDIPANVAPGTYYLQLSINSKDARRVVYREFIVNT